MPIYEYQCENCGEFEVTQKITDNPLKRCPTCKGKVKRLISNTYFQLKGSGWYLTDYGRKDRDRKEKKEGKAPAADAKSDGKGSSASETGEKSSAEKKSTGTASSESTSS